MNRRIWLFSAFAGTCLLAALVVAALLWAPAYRGNETIYIHLREGDSAPQRLNEAGVRSTGFHLLALAGYRLRPGRYAANPGESLFTIFRRLRSGQQAPVRLTLPSLRTTDRLASFLGQHLMMDSAEVARSFADSAFTAPYGYSPQTLPALFIPNTYEVYWDISLSRFMQRMQRENHAFWTSARLAKARAAGLTPVEVATLASIVDEETANNAEKPMVAGMYIRRLRIGMPLQADPTVKFALRDFGLRRIREKHLQAESPYNTYRHTGLPPGPIRIPSVAGIEAVLDHVPHDCIYMCAKEDFSGTHNFARTYAEHLRNARRYVEALNARGIE